MHRGWSSTKQEGCNLLLPNSFPSSDVMDSNTWKPSRSETVVIPGLGIESHVTDLVSLSLMSSDVPGTD